MGPPSPRQSGRSGGGRATALAAVLALQALCAVFFVADVVSDLSWVGLDAHTAFEGVVALALLIGVGFGGLEMRRTLERSRRAETAVAAASGAFAELIAASFDRWALTPAEAEVALFALKGLDVAEIAAARGAAAGTVRAQLTRVYAKAGVSSRSQFISLFIDDLLGSGLVQAERQGPGEAGHPDPAAARPGTTRR